MAKFIKNILKKRVIELKNSEMYKISKAISVRIYSHGHMDSFALIKAGNNTILNINDCVLKSKKSLSSLKNRLFQKNIDVLMSQYSFASFQGNEEEKSALIKAGNQHIEWIKQRNDFFKPKVFIPFASDILWCAE